MIGKRGIKEENGRMRKTRKRKKTNGKESPIGKEISRGKGRVRRQDIMRTHKGRRHEGLLESSHCNVRSEWKTSGTA